MNIKITMHLMPWEIDNALLSFSQLKKSYYHISSDVNITIETVMNMSSKFIDWEKSKLPKEFFISKYNDISLLLNDYNHIKRIYDGDELYGFLNLQKESISKEVDYYIGICPDIDFSEHLLALLIECAKLVKNEYFVITPQTYKKWDSSWDEITDKRYMNVPYSEYDDFDIFKTRHEINSTPIDPILTPVKYNKWAWWFDLYNKKFYEELCPVPEDWNGYGPWDWYSMLLSETAKQKGFDMRQYLLEGETILETSSGFLKERGFGSYYKQFLSLIPDYAPVVQRKFYEENINFFLERGIKTLNLK